MLNVNIINNCKFVYIDIKLSIYISLMFDKLAILRIKGYYPDTILDIGAHHGNWTIDMKRIFNESSYHLFEGIDYHELNRFNNHDNIKIHNVILNDKIEQVPWYQMKNTGDSMFREKTHHFVKCEVIIRETIDLDTYVCQKNILNESKNIFIKIDCQGAEISILKGIQSLDNDVASGALGLSKENTARMLSHKAPNFIVKF